MKPQYDVLALLSGGLDSILAAKLLQAQGKRVLCLHFVTPFFGKPHLVAKWKDVYGLEALPVDVSDEFVSMLQARPVHGFGKVLNPCMDCKILLLRKAREMMADFGATVLITGEVLGQRPMSQRKDALNIIRREAGVADVLLRPLCARHQPPTTAETTGFIDRTLLKGFSGRGRKGQLALAAEYGITDIPTPAGGCLLTEKETARNYWPLLRLIFSPTPDDFRIAKSGRQFWQFSASPAHWLTIGRTQSDNAALVSLAKPGDLLFSLADFTGPTALGRMADTSWDGETIRTAAAHTVSFSGKAATYALESGKPVTVRVRQPGNDGESRIVVVPSKGAGGWAEYSWERAKEEIRAEARIAAQGH